MSDELKTTERIEVTQEMMDVGREVFRIVAERHGFDGLLNVPFIHNAIASTYLAMAMERAGLPRRKDW